MKVVLMLAFCACVGMSFASFNMTGNEYFDKIKDKEKGKNKSDDKFSLKNMHKPASFFSLSSIGSTKFGCDNYQFLPNKFQWNLFTESRANTDDESGAQVNSAIRLRTRNSVVIYPYNFKVKADPFRLFKTPTPQTR